MFPVPNNGFLINVLIFGILKHTKNHILKYIDLLYIIIIPLIRSMFLAIPTFLFERGTVFPSNSARYKPCGGSRNERTDLFLPLSSRQQKVHQWLCRRPYHGSPFFCFCFFPTVEPNETLRSFTTCACRRENLVMESRNLYFVVAMIQHYN